MTFSANLGFGAVECHSPYDTPAAETLAALSETGLTMLGLNTGRGSTTIGENGIAALPGREAEAPAYARATGIRAAFAMAFNRH